RTSARSLGRLAIAPVQIAPTVGGPRLVSTSVRTRPYAGGEHRADERGDTIVNRGVLAGARSRDIERGRIDVRKPPTKPFRRGRRRELVQVDVQHRLPGSTRLLQRQTRSPSECAM